MVPAAPATNAAPASDDLQIIGPSISKESIDDPAVAGDNVTLRFTIENDDADNDATNIFFRHTFIDVLPGTPDLSVTTMLPISACGGTVSLSGSLLIFSGGSSSVGAPPCEFDIEFLVPAGAADGDYISSTNSPTATIDSSSVTLNPAVVRWTPNVRWWSALSAEWLTYREPGANPGRSPPL